MLQNDVKISKFLRRSTLPKEPDKVFGSIPHEAQQHLLSSYRILGTIPKSRYKDDYKAIASLMQFTDVQLCSAAMAPH